MDNYAIADNFSMLAKLMDIHGENSFKSKNYSIAAFTIENLPVQLSSLPTNKIFTIKGIGESTGKKIIEQLETGELKVLNDYLDKTPEGVLEMLNVKGLGPKKISIIWKELGIEDIGELLYACNENRLALYTGFGAGTQRNIKEAIEYYLDSQGSYLFAKIEKFANDADKAIKKAFPKHHFLQAGDFRRHLEVIEKLEWVTTATADELEKHLLKDDYEIVQRTEDEVEFKGKENVRMIFYHTSSKKIHETLFVKSCSTEFLTEWLSKFQFEKTYKSEEEIFSKAKVDFIEAYLRETKEIIVKAQKHKLPEVIQAKDITGLIHCHSKWSDGINTIEEMAKGAKQRGMQYMLITDHSKTATYAKGLSEERIIAQHEEIEELKKKLSPFKIFKGIESDILNDGSLDYPPDVLSTFDVIIASPHSNLKMEEEKATKRLINAIENPYTSILGHATGRLLLSRRGLRIDHKKIIDACAANNVVIEINSNPRRLDMDWRHLDYCLRKNVLLSIDPDAHSTDEIDVIKYGVLVAQKAGVAKENNLSSYTLKQFETFIKKQHAKR